MNIRSIRPIRTFIFSGLLAGVCLATLIAFDYRFGSQEIVYQLTYCSKKEILMQFIENGLYIAALMFSTALVTQLLYWVSPNLGRIAIFCSLISAAFVLYYSPLLAIVFCIYWFINLLLIRGVRL